MAFLSLKCGMSESYPFDTHKFVKRLTEVGLDERIAETLADEQVKLLTSQLATKAELANIARDIERMRQETHSSIEQLRQETQSSIEQLRQDTKSQSENLRPDVDHKIEKVIAEPVRWIAAFGMTIIALNLAGFALLITRV